VGSAVTTSSTTLATATFTANVAGNIRIELRKTDGTTNRLSIDDITISSYSDGGTTPPPTGFVENDNMAFGNPSGAVTNIVSANNYLMVKPQYALGYSNAKLTPIWTSWHLQSSDIGSAARQDDFRADTTLPSGWYQVGSTEYSGSGFDRGHMCPSADRTSTVANNSATFLMTNMIPQAPKNNQITWANLENYCRTLVNAGNELYIISGPYGQGGAGSNGAKTTVGNGVVVPSKTWKIILVLPAGSNDLGRVTTSTRVIAVVMPNDQTCSNNPWGSYRVSVDSIETLTGFDFFKAIPAAVQDALEAAVDTGATS
jgi:endonuclease G